jgi:hypothetical protein
MTNDPTGSSLTFSIAVYSSPSSPRNRLNVDTPFSRQWFLFFDSSET